MADVKADWKQEVGARRLRRPDDMHRRPLFSAIFSDLHVTGSGAFGGRVNAPAVQQSNSRPNRPTAIVGPFPNRSTCSMIPSDKAHVSLSEGTFPASGPRMDGGSPGAHSGQREPFSIYDDLIALDREGTAFVLVVLVEALGSTPQDTGAKMLVTADSIRAGTVGGGRVEAAALAIAREMLDKGGAGTRFVSWSLKGDVGMTCGGSVKLYFEAHPSVESVWPIAVFGAGHVVQALMPVLLPLPCTITVCDPRPEWLDMLPKARNLRVVRHDRPAELVLTLRDDTYLLCLTKGHQADRPILHRALAERNFPFIGVIGSDAKAAVLRREMIAEGLPPERAGLFHCPVGLDFGSNHPHEIAISIASQLLSERDRLARGGLQAHPPS